MELSKPNIKELRENLDVEELIKALQYSDWHVRRDAASAIDKIAKEGKVAPLLKKAVEPLKMALKDENAEVRAHAAQALHNLFWGAAFYPDEKAWAFDEMRIKKVLEALIGSFLKDKDERVRKTAILAVGAIPVPMRLGRGERIIRRDEEVRGAAANGFLLLTNKRLIFHACDLSESYSLDIPLTEIISCEIKKKSLFGKEKLLLEARRGILKSWSNLVMNEVAKHGFSQPPESVVILNPIEFTNIKEVERLKSEIMEQRASAYKSLPPKVEKCLSCGVEILVGAEFCPNCGRKVKQA